MSDYFFMLKSVYVVLLISFWFKPVDLLWLLSSAEFIFISWCFSRLVGCWFYLNVGSWFWMSIPSCLYATAWALSNMLRNFAASSYVSGRDCELLKSEVARTVSFAVISCFLTSLLNDSCSSASNVLLFWDSVWTVGMISSICILFGFISFIRLYWFLC